MTGHVWLKLLPGATGDCELDGQKLKVTIVDVTVDDELTIRVEQVARPAPQPRRVTVNLGASDTERLDRLTEETHLNRNDVIRQALATEAFVQRTLSEGRKLLVEDADGNIREVEFVR